MTDRKYTEVIPYWNGEPVIDPETGLQKVDYYGNPIFEYTSSTNLPGTKQMREQWCFGLPLTDGMNVPISNDTILAYLNSAIDKVERYLGIYLKPTIIACNAEERGLIQGVEYDKEEPPYDYNNRQWMQYGFLQLRERPLLELHEYALRLVNDQLVFDFMSKPAWIKLNKLSGQLRIAPYAGDPAIYNVAVGTMAGFPFLTGLIQGNIPHMLHISYVAGYAVGQIPYDVAQAVAKMAAIDLLGVAGDAVLAGVASMSTSIDGLSESLSTTASATSATYGAHINQLKKEVDDFFNEKKNGARSSERGITMTFL